MKRRFQQHPFQRNSMSFGNFLIISSLTLALLSALFMDVLILIISIAIALIALILFLIGYIKINKIKSSSIIPSTIESKIIAGSNESFNLIISNKERIKLYVKHPLKFCNIKPQPCYTNEPLILEISPKLAGIYETNWLEIESHEKVFTFSKKLPFETKLIVLPKVFPLIVRALELAMALGKTMHEIIQIQALGRGTEYAETREYLPGDDIKRLDWKATARLQRLMVKQYHQEYGGAVNLIYDMKSAGPITKDATAAEFLRMVIALAEQNIPFTITIVNEKLETFKFKDLKSAILTAINYALKAIEIDIGFLYELMEPHKETLMALMSMEKPMKGQLLDGDVIAITCLLGDLTWLIDIHESMKNGKLIVHVPFKAWLDSKSLEQAYMDYEHQAKIIKMLRKKGIIVESN
ncbi:MAG: DUF58 domain-containing protein [Nitrososphaerota archaeon]|nr:DUF58 domain-containing protein [Nitrososphaerota archaeon]